MNYALRTYNSGDQQYKGRFERVLEKETIDLLLALFIHIARYGIRYFQQGGPRIMESQWYSILTPFPRCTMQLLNIPHIIELFFSGNLDLGRAFMAVDRQREVDWTYVGSEMEVPFLWNDCAAARVVPLPIREWCEVTITGDHILAKWFVRLFPAVEASMTCALTWKIEKTRREVHWWAVGLKLVLSAAEIEKETSSYPHLIVYRRYVRQQNTRSLWKTLELNPWKVLNSNHRTYFDL